MTSTDQLKDELRRQVLAKQEDAAEAAARSLGPDAGQVLLELAEHKKASVRVVALSTAVQNPSPDCSRVILGRLDDDDPTARSVARSSIGRCSQKEVLPDLLKAMKKHGDADVRGALALQVGVVGNKRNIKDLEPFRAAADDPQLAHDVGLAMARLGDAGERDALLGRLVQDDPHVRTQALRDCQYVQDRDLARQFGPALSDDRDVVNIADPHEPPEFARVCDVAVQVLASLGYELSFDARFLERRPDEQVAEARALVEALSEE